MTGSEGPVTIEDARVRDALATLALHRAVLAEGRWFVTEPHELMITLELREHQIRSLGQSDNGCFLVARRPPVRVAGFLTLTGGSLARTRHLARLELMVAAQHRGEGIGRALVQHALDRAGATGVLRKVSLAVFADNTRAVALYHSLGFVQEGHRRGEYLEADGTERDDLILCRSVGPTPC